MKKLLLILCLFSITAHAEWKVYDSDDIKAMYHDYEKIESDGVYKYIYELVDFKKITGSRSKSKSVISKFLIDCQSQAIQVIGFYDYSENMGTGKVLDSLNLPIDKSQWAYPPANSNGVGRKLINAACGRK